MLKRIADTGLIVAFLNRRDPFHLWALDAFTRLAPFYICEAVLVESASFFPTPSPVLTLVERGDLVLDPDFLLSQEMHAVRALTEKYADCPMDLADACIVRMAEITRDCKVWTVDRADFLAYRRNVRESIPCEFPPNVECARR